MSPLAKAWGWRLAMVLAIVVGGWDIGRLDFVRGFAAGVFAWYCTGRAATWDWVHRKRQWLRENYPEGP